MDFLELAINAAKAAGKLTLEKQGHVKMWEKNPQDIVTEADIACEKLIKDMILAKYPNHSFLAEEGGLSGGGEYQWIIDPIDGTENYARGYHEFCVAIALKKNAYVLLSVIYLPVLDKLYAAQYTFGSQCDGKKITISKRSLENSVVCFQYAKEKVLHKPGMYIIDKLMPVITRVRITGSSSIAFCELAEGQIDAIVKIGKKKIWDALPGILMVKEAGAIVTDFEGNEWNENSESMVASNKELHKELLKLLR